MENEAFEKFLETGTIESFLKYKEIQRLTEKESTTNNDIENLRSE